MCVTRLIFMRSITPQNVCCESFVCVTWRIRICVLWFIPTCAMIPSYVWRDSFLRVTWLLHMCDVTHSYVWHVAFICVTWLIHMWHDFLICVTWLVRECAPLFFHMHDTTKFYAFYDSFIGVTWLIYMSWLLDTCDVKYSHVWHDSLWGVARRIHICAMTPP